MKKIENELIISIVQKGYSHLVVESARSAGASGSTIVGGRGSGIHENEKILGISIEPEKELVLTLVPSSIKKDVMKAILKGTNLSEPGNGICFSLPVLDVEGINHKN